ncbi:hypothetical protein SEA_BURRO_22 [Microbacterium phage Burro]|uniref:Lipoprotein n=1 Tax=Microbacterium phage Burro TaxID=2315703 RepID=A0A386KKI9_9CAUD|nr:hypothetical protein HWB89_gp22 [Microbacterium phage Burro]AYD86165.1 hypothetical protein SEA_BURRO_22 [Microbacterium phage Burro]
MKVKALTLVVLLLVLTGCSAISQGYVTNKHYSPAYYTYNQVCVSYDTKTGMCKTYMPQQQYHPANWRLDLAYDDETGWVNVSENTFDEYEVGDFYPKGVR